MNAIGKLDWAFSGGRIPFDYNGEELLFMSYDRVSILNTGNNASKVEIFVFLEDEIPICSYNICIKAKRVLKINLNELIDPIPLVLGKNYACYIKSSKKIVVQFSRLNTGQSALAEMTTMAYPIDE